jgi:hypothetical protein
MANKLIARSFAQDSRKEKLREDESRKKPPPAEQ